MENSNPHTTVLLHEAVDGLNIKPDGVYLDGTFGRGGHSRLILQKLNEKGRLIALDRDLQAAETAKDFEKDPRFSFFHQDFADIRSLLEQQGELYKIGGIYKLDGILLDLGVSSPQLDQADRGFSFSKDGPLDMRMDTSKGISAKDWVNSASVEEMKKVLKEYGEEKFAVRIAKAIVNARAIQVIERTLQLAEIVKAAVPNRPQRIHPATRTFQAIRIFVNQELRQLELALAASIDLLATGGRLCVISFHSLEDRRVKRFMRDASRETEQYRGMPVVPEEHRPPFRLVGKAIVATPAEIELNARSRSARLRIAERL